MLNKFLLCIQSVSNNCGAYKFSLNGTLYFYTFYGNVIQREEKKISPEFALSKVVRTCQLLIFLVIFFENRLTKLKKQQT